MQPDSAYDWDEQTQLDQINAENEAKAHERAKAYHHIFAQDPLGQRILGEWINRFCTGGVPGVNASARETAMRDGKQELISEILAQINIAAGVNDEG